MKRRGKRRELKFSTVGGKNEQVHTSFANGSQQDCLRNMVNVKNKSPKKEAPLPAGNRAAKEPRPHSLDQILSNTSEAFVFPPGYKIEVDPKGLGLFSQQANLAQTITSDTNKLHEQQEKINPEEERDSISPTNL